MWLPSSWWAGLLEGYNVTSKSPVGDISVATLIKTGTTLDHSQKAEKVTGLPEGFPDRVRELHVGVPERQARHFERAGDGDLAGLPGSTILSQLCDLCICVSLI